MVWQTNSTFSSAIKADKSVSTHDVKCGYAENAVRIVDTNFLEHFAGNWNSAIITY